MKTESKDKLPTHKTFGQKLHIYFNEEEIEKQMEIDSEETETFYRYDTAVAKTTDDRNTLISKIIHSRYSVDDEIATINNKEESPEEYQAYQEFRAQAKVLVDGWINK